MSEVKQEPGVFAKRVADLTREVALLRKAMVILLTDLNAVGDLSLRAARELEKLLGEGGE